MDDDLSVVSEDGTVVQITGLEVSGVVEGLLALGGTSALAGSTVVLHSVVSADGGSLAVTNGELVGDRFVGEGTSAAS